MEKSQNNYWENIYSDENLQFPIYDGWLSAYVEEMGSDYNIVDLGCGNGVNTLFLHKLGIKTVACDFSESALNRLVGLLPKALVMQFDMTCGLPFYCDNIDMVIADLSIHYFSKETTKKLVAEIERILRPNGVILCRVNCYESGFIASMHNQIETDYFLVDGCTKRFFTVNSIKEYFENWKIVKVELQQTDKYRSRKSVVFLEARKK